MTFNFACMHLDVFVFVFLPPGPLFLKKAVDALGGVAGDALAAAAAAQSAILCWCGCDLLKNFAKELQHPTFTPVSQVRGGAVGRACLIWWPWLLLSLISWQAVSHLLQSG